MTYIGSFDPCGAPRLSASALLATLERSDPRQVRTLSVLSLFEQQQERLPPVLMNETVLSYDDLPWAETFSVQARLSAWPICCYLQSFL